MSLSPGAARALLYGLFSGAAGCALVYGYGDYQPASSEGSGGGASTSESASHGATTSATSGSGGAGGSTSSTGPGTGGAGGQCTTSSTGGGGCGGGIDPSVNKTHCGTCAIHDCLGGDCVGGQCQSLHLNMGTMVAELSADDTYVYFQYLSGSFKVGRIAKVVGAVVEHIADETNNAGQVVIDDKRVFFSNGYMADIGFSTKDLQTSGTLFAPGVVQAAFGMVVDQGNVYFNGRVANVLGLYRAPAGGENLPATAPLAMSGAAYHVVAEGTYVLWLDNQTNAIYRYREDDSESAALVVPGGPPIADIAAASGMVFAGRAGMVEVWSIANKTMITMLPGGAKPDILQVAANGGYVYWLIGDNMKKYDVMRTPLCKLGQVERVAQDLSYAASIGFDATAIYWGNQDGIFRVAK